MCPFHRKCVPGTFNISKFGINDTACIPEEQVFGYLISLTRQETARAIAAEVALQLQMFTNPQLNSTQLHGLYASIAETFTVSNYLNFSLHNESVRAQGAEFSLATTIGELASTSSMAVESATARAQSVEGSLALAITTTETSLGASISYFTTKEQVRATAVENSLALALFQEQSRSFVGESSLAAQSASNLVAIKTEQSRAESTESSLALVSLSYNQRAMVVEASLAGAGIFVTSELLRLFIYFFLINVLMHFILIFFCLF